MKDAGLLVRELAKTTTELEWVEFKTNNKDPKMIGRDISALANSATHREASCAYMIWGVDDVTHEVVGTEFDHRTLKCGNEEVENWLHHQLSGNASFEFVEGECDGRRVVVLSVRPAFSHTVDFENVAYIRVGSYTKPLKSYPAIEAEVWNKITKADYEASVALEDVPLRNVLELLDYAKYFELLGLPLPQTQEETARYLGEDCLVVKQDDGRFAVTNLGALLLARNLSDFAGLERKAVRIVKYEGTGRRAILKDRVSLVGYANGFEQTIEYFHAILPSSEPIGDALRTQRIPYPAEALRELMANMLVHQDLTTSGNGPLVEVFDDRIEFTNPGASLVEPLRLLDNPPRSRNQRLAALMRRFGICEELGTGWDKVVMSCEEMFLPSPKVDDYESGAGSMKVTLRARVPFSSMLPSDRVMAAYWHACVCYMEGAPMGNASLRARFGADGPSASTISRLIRDTVNAGLIKPYDPNGGRKYMTYVPAWA